VFNRRSRNSVTDEAESHRPVIDQGKGRPTPKRREAERERRERVRPPRTGRERAVQQKRKRADERARLRQGMDAGDDRYVPNRDKGPVRRFVRDYVDGRMSAGEFFMPIAVAALILMVAGAGGIGGSLSSVMILIVLFDSAVLSFSLRRTLARKFPDEPRRGAIPYGLMRALTWRSLRTPKPQVPRGHRP
jgi:hypothetical protein